MLVTRLKNDYDGNDHIEDDEGVEDLIYLTSHQVKFLHLAHLRAQQNSLSVTL